MNTQSNTAVTTISPKDVVLKNIQAMKGHFQQALPPDVNVDQFTRVVLTALQQNQDLMGVDDKQSLYNSCVKAAQDGLLPDGREGALVIFNKKDGNNWKKGVQWMPMVNGLVKRAAKSGIVLDAHVVYANDQFNYTLGDSPTITHVPTPFSDNRGEPIGVYAIATLDDGTKKREVMSKAEVETVRQASKMAGGGPWKDWWSEMARKTVVRRLFKSLPLKTPKDPTMASAVTRVDEDLDDVPPVENQAVVSEPEKAVQTTAQTTAPATRAKILEQESPSAQEEDLI